MTKRFLPGISFPAFFPIIFISAVSGLALSIPLMARAEGVSKNKPPVFQLVKTTMDGTGDAPRLCLHFNQPLDRQDASALAHFVTLSPALPFLPEVTQNVFCLDDLRFSTAYEVSVEKGFSDAKGQRLSAPLHLTAQFGPAPVKLAMSGEGYILPGTATSGLAIQSQHVAQARIHVFRLPTSVLIPGAGGPSDNGLTTPDFDMTTIYPYVFQALLESQLQDVWHGVMPLTGKNSDKAGRLTAFPLARVLEKVPPPPKTLLSGASFPLPRGLYLVTLENAATPADKSQIERILAGKPTDDNGPAARTPARWVAVSDLGLSLVRGDEGLTAGLRSFSSGKPVAGASVALVAKNGDILGSQKTDAEGQAQFPAALLHGKNAYAPARLVAGLNEAGQNGDATFMSLDGAWFDLSEQDVGGSPRPSGPVQALVQLDRDIYRPGETANALVLLRDRTGNAASLPDTTPANAPATLILERPDGLTELKKPLLHGADGGYTTALPLGLSVPLGAWTVKILRDPTRPPIGTARFTVKDFTPQLIAVNFKAPAFAVPGAPLSLAGEARFLYGAPGAGLTEMGTYRTLVDPTPIPALAKESGWTFGVGDVSSDLSSGTLPEATTDAQGQAEVTFTPTLPETSDRPLKVAVNAGVLEPSGRRVSQNLDIPVKRSDSLIGVRVPGQSDASAGKVSVPAEIAAFGPDNQPLKERPLRWKLARVNVFYDWALEAGSYGWSFRRHTQDVPMEAGTVKTDAAGRAHLAPQLAWGQYKLTLTDPKGGTTEDDFRVGWGASAQSNTPDRLPVTISTTNVRPGEKVLLHIGKGFAGQAQISLATNKILSARDVTVPPEGLDVPITAQDDWGDGAYALVTLYRPLAPAQSPLARMLGGKSQEAGPQQSGSQGARRPHDPVRAVGIAWIGLNQSAHKLALAVDAPPVVQSRKRVTIPVQVRDSEGRGVSQAHLVVSGVDEGILALTGFHPLDLFDILYGRKRLTLDMRDNYGALLLTDALAGQPRSGGDSEDAGAPSAAPLRHRENVDLFDGPVALDEQGRGNVSFEVPDFDGQLHLMGAVWTEKGVGNAQKDMIVRDPAFPDLGLPPFLAPGDRADVAVSIVDTTAPAGRYVVRASSEGPLSFPGPTSFAARIGPDTRRDTRMPLVAKGIGGAPAADGKAILTLSKDGGALLARDWPLTVRTGHFPFTTSIPASLGPNERAIFGANGIGGEDLKEFDPATLRLTLGATETGKLDVIGLQETIDLAGTTNSSSDLADLGRALLVSDPTLLSPPQTPKQVHDRIQKAVDTLLDRQGADGAVGQWEAADGRSLPGDNIMIADFLSRAHQAAYAVPEDRLDLLLNMLDTTLLQNPPAPGEDEANLSSKEAQSQGYKISAAYVLARAGHLRPHVLRSLADSLLNQKWSQKWSDTPGYYWSSVNGSVIPATSIGMGTLAAALALNDLSDVQGGAVTPGTLFERAILDLGPARSGPPPSWRKGGGPYLAYWSYVYQTATVFSLAAQAHDETHARQLLDRLSRLEIAPKDYDTSTITDLLEGAKALNSTGGRSLRIADREIVLPQLPAALPVSLASVRKGFSVVNSGAMPVDLFLVLHGLPAGDVGAKEAGVSIDRTGYTLDGTPLDLTHLKQNQRFIVCLEGDVDVPGTWPVLLTSMLPAGWEVESVIAPKEVKETSHEDDDNIDDNIKAKLPYGFLKYVSALAHVSVREDRVQALMTVTRESTLPMIVADPQKTTGQFRVAFIARAVTPGQFALPETVVNLRHHPAIMGRTASEQITIAPQAP